MRSGVVSTIAGGLKRPGYYGDGMSSWAYINSERNLRLHFTDIDVQTHNESLRYDAFPLRCLSTVLDYVEIPIIVL